MTCEELAVTGQPVWALVVFGAAAVLLGLLLTVLTRRRGARQAVLAISLLGIGVVTAGSAAPDLARAGQLECGTQGAGTDLIIQQLRPDPAPPNRGDAGAPVSIGQISSPVGIAPGVGPAAIVGRLVNQGAAAIYIAAVTVEISAVDKAADAVPGACDETDYELISPTMPVGRTLLPGESAVFSGAFIGFRNKPLNQDACQAAIVELAYFSS